MIEIPVHNSEGQQVDALQIDEQALGGEVRPVLLKQAYVRFAANRRQDNAHTRSRGEVKSSGRKLYKQKGSGNARHGPAGVNLMRGGGHTFAKRSRSWRQRMPVTMRRLANRNALLAKAVDGEIKLVDRIKFDKASSKQFSAILQNLEINRSCLLALEDTRGHEAQSAANVEHVSLTRIDQLNAYDLLNHRYLMVEKQTLVQWLSRSDRPDNGGTEASS